MPECKECGRYFTRSDNLNRHMLRYHAGDDESVMTNDNADTIASGDIFDNDSDGEAEYSDSDTDMELDSDDAEDLGDVIKNKIARLVDSNRDVYDQMVEEYVENGMNLEKSQEKANSEMVKHNRDKWLDQYSNTLITIESMKQNEVHKAIRKLVHKYVDDKGYDITEAIKAAVNKRKFGFDKYIKEYDSEDEEESTSGEEDTSS